MGSILPYYSPAITGGGVSENFFKEMMAEMQGAGGLPGAMPGMLDAAAQAGASGSGSGGEQKKVKEKKKKVKG
jgi:signal recognition particle subunit SRP19